MEHWSRLLDYIPFVAMVNGKITVNTARLVEAAIIAIVTGFLTSYITLAKMEIRVANIEKKIDKIYEDIYAPRFTK